MAGKRILLVEGTDDEHVVKHLCGAHGLPRFDRFVRTEGVRNLLERLAVQLKESDLAVLGIVVDADTDLPARWQALRTRLEEAGYAPMPSEPTPEGTILPAPADSLLPRVGVWLMPDNRANGILEDFVRFLVPQGDALIERAEGAIDGIPADEQRFSSLARPKALIHTWLAWQESPGRPLGTAITARYLDPCVPQAAAFVNWLRTLSG